MTRTLRLKTVRQPRRSARPRPPRPADAPAPAVRPADWQHAVELLATTVRHRDGDAEAARHAEIRRRMRALARAARSPGRAP